MEADFSGWATKAGLECSDGKTIMPGAFKNQDQARVPLVWQHGHSDPENVLGHAILEYRDEGVYAHAFFNSSAKAQHAKHLVEHKDITMLSIWANDLVQRSGKVLHGAIREVSLVLSGANPGALIENVTVSHSDGDELVLDDEVIIWTGLELELAHSEETQEDDLDEEDEIVTEEVVSHAEEDAGEEDLTVGEVYESMSEVQKSVVHYMVGEALQASQDADSDEVQQSDNQEGTTMTNVFEKGSETAPDTFISHADVQGIVGDAMKSGSLREAVEEYALSHGIQDIDVLFPDARALSTAPEWDARRTEWVSGVLNGVRKSPFSRIKTMSADITVEEARAKGYVTGNLKKEEFFRVKGRVTTPTTIYKKQKLDRDDMVDITDFDVVTWLKGEMRLMLDEELARAILIGDGRPVDHEDKIDEDNIRPIAKDHELYTTTVYVNLDDAQSTVQEIIDGIVENRKYFKGSGMPTMYTTETYIAKFLLLKDTLGRRIYESLDKLALELRVSAIVPVEVMEEEEDVVAVLVNLNDYVVGADKGGNISMFDDFDIDYNQYKYLIETRVCGALTKVKSALVVKKVASTLVRATPEEPGFVADTGVITIPTVTGVSYRTEAAPTVPLSPGAMAALSAGASNTIIAVPATGYYFSTSQGDTWTFTRDS
jgi:hypothetical protein